MAGEPRVQYVSTSDGVSIAYADTGGPGYPVVYLRGAPFTQVQEEWRQDSYRFWYDAAFGGRRLITLDFRGCGLSDREPAELTLEAFMRDLDAVIGRLGVEDFAISATQADSLVALRYAAENPDRVSHLILWDGYASGAGFADIPQTRAFLSMMENDWNLFVSTLAHFMNEWDSPAAREYVTFIEHACTQEQALRFFKDYVLHTDVSDVLPKVSQPTIIFSHRSMTIPDFETARGLAARIPNAELVVLEGTWGRHEDDPRTVNAALGRLLGDDAGPQAPPLPAAPERSLAGSLVTILFTDVEGSTALTQRLGDAKAREVLREHERITREALAAHGGSEVKTLGDGFMASFGSAARALECAAAIQQAFVEQPVKVRIGLNAGEPIAEGEDLFGTAVILAARIAAQAQGGEIFVSNVVRELVAGRGFLFSDQGERALRGFEDPVRVYELSWRDS
jgi:class 3 adenylate cyclase